MNTLKALMALKPKKKLNAGYLLSLLISVVTALLLGGVIMALTGHNPFEGYAALLQGVVGSPRALGNTLAKSMTLCLLGLATVVAAKAGIFNVGGEGQLFLGAIASAWLGSRLEGVSPWIGLPLCLLIAMAVGGLYAFIPGWLKVKMKVNEVITTIMLNSAAIYFCSYLANGPLRTADRGISAGTDAIAKSLMFPRLIPLSSLTQSVFLGALIALFVWYLLSRTAAGFEMKLTGQNQRFAQYMGFQTDQLALWAMVASGAICGLVGMFETFGLHGRFIEGVSVDFYFDGMLVAMIMRYNPLGTILMSFFFGALKVGATTMEAKVGIPSELILMVQSIIIFFMAAESGISANLRMKRAQRKAMADTRKGAAL